MIIQLWITIFLNILGSVTPTKNEADFPLTIHYIMIYGTIIVKT